MAVLVASFCTVSEFTSDERLICFFYPFLRCSFSINRKLTRIPIDVNDISECFQYQMTLLFGYFTIQPLTCVGCLLVAVLLESSKFVEQHEQHFDTCMRTVSIVMR